MNVGELYKKLDDIIETEQEGSLLDVVVRVEYGMAGIYQIRMMNVGYADESFVEKGDLEKDDEANVLCIFLD